MTNIEINERSSSITQSSIDHFLCCFITEDNIYGMLVADTADLICGVRGQWSSQAELEPI